MAEFRRDLRGERVVISPGRAARPYDYYEGAERRRAKCPFCPGREDQTPPEVFAVRSGSAPNEPGWRLRVVPNLYPAVPREPDSGADDPAFGVHEVFIETPDHDLSLAELGRAGIRLVLEAWRARLLAARADSRLRHGLIFKNRGQSAGASLEHAHSQLVALPFLPQRSAAEAAAFRSGAAERRILAEMEDAVADQGSLIAWTPAASRFSYELWAAPAAPAASFEDESDARLDELAALLDRLLNGLDRMLDRPDYHLLLHTAPFGEEAFWWRIELFPRLSKVAGYEWATGVFFNQTPPEKAANSWRKALAG